MTRLLLAAFLGLWITASYGAPASALAFSPDGSVLASGAHRQVELREVPSGNISGRIPCELSRICSLQFSPDGQLLAITGGTPGENGAALILRWRDKTILRRITNYADVVTGAAFDTNSASIALSSADSSATIYALDSRDVRPSVSLEGHSGPVLAIARSPDNQLIVTASADRSLKVWSPADGKLLRSFSHHTEAVHAVTFRPRPEPEQDSPMECASASDDATVRVWQPTIGRMVRIIRGHDGPIFALAYSPDGKDLFSAGKDGIIRRLDTQSDQILGEHRAGPEPIYRIAISPNGNYLAAGDWAGRISLWQTTGGEFRKLTQ